MWIQTYSGKAVYPLSLTVDQVCAEDIAWALAHQCRYAGHSNRFYSVAEHSMHLASLLEGKAGRLAALLHDASEAYLIDLPSPIKQMMPNYCAAEEQVMQVIAEWAEISVDMFEAIKELDMAILADEQAVLMPNNPMNWNFAYPEGLGLKDAINLFPAQYASPKEVAQTFLRQIQESLRKDKCLKS